MKHIRISVGEDVLEKARAEYAVKYLKKKIDDVKFELVNHDSKGISAGLHRLEDKKAEIMIVDLSEYRRYVDKTGYDNKNIITAALLQRENPQNVLITRKKHSENIKNPLVVVDCLSQQYELDDIFEGAKYEMSRKSIPEKIDCLHNKKCDGIVLPAFSVKLLKVDKIREFSYRYLDESRMVPESGQAVLAVLARNNGRLLECFQYVTHIKTYKECCLEEQLSEMIKKINIEELKYLCVYAKITRDEMEMNTYTVVHNYSFCNKIKGKYDKNQQLLNEIYKRIVKNADI